MVKFISYTGEYPNLCSGILTLDINGIIEKFGYYENEDASYGKFWSSGEDVWFSKDYREHVTEGKWIIDKNQLPEKYRHLSKEIEEVFNENVPYGCCGGCV